MTALRLSGLCVSQGGQAVLQGIDLDLARAEYLCLLGRSGSGKSTLLGAVAGFVRPSGGRIEIDGRCVFDAARRIDEPSQQRGLGMVFQEALLWPHLSVIDNVLFPLRARGLVADRRWAQALLERVGLLAFANRRPDALSGGQRQRVAICRALAAKPRLVLLDEPLSAVDGPTRQELRDYLQSLFAESGTTALHVTHDPAEAFALGHRVAILEAGVLRQIDAPEQIYRRPASADVARLTGPAQIIPVEVVDTDVGAGQFRFDDQVWQAPAHPAVRKGDARLVLRPHSITVRPGGGAWRVRRERFDGVAFVLELEHPRYGLLQGLSRSRARSGEFLQISLRAQDCWLLPAESEVARTP